MDSKHDGRKVWQAASARHRFTELLAAADTGRPQVIHHRNGQEYVLVSKKTFDAMKPDLLTVLTSFDFGEGPDEFDRALAFIRSPIEHFDSDHVAELDDLDAAGHGRDKRDPVR